MRSDRVSSRFGSLLLALVGWSSAMRASKWRTLANQPQNRSGGAAVIEGCHLLTDGTVMCLETGK